jgi:protein-S-isoprenylcysteine O-methyltransferase Ste14
MHSLLASLWVKDACLRRFGPAYERWYRLAYNLVAALSFVPLAGLAAWLPDRALYAIRMPWLALTLLAQALAALALLAGVLQTGAGSFLGLAQVIRPQTGAGAQLVTGGAYRFVRHPLYSAGLMLMWLTPHMSLNLLALYAALTAYIFIGAALEERKLLRQFGQAYADYRRRTPMFLPRWWG